MSVLKGNAVRMPRRSSRRTLPARGSYLEELLESQIKEVGLRQPEREHRFHGKRRWRFDFAYVDLKLAVEVEGGVWSGGRHTTGKGFAGDCEKYNAAVLCGWRVLRFTGDMIAKGEAIQIIGEALNG